MGALSASTQIIPVHNATPGYELDTALVGDRVNTNKFGWCSIILYSADVAAIVTYTVQDHVAVTGGTPRSLVAVGTYWRKSANTNLDAVGVFSAVTNDPLLATAVTVTGEINLLVLEIDISLMDEGRPFLGVIASDPGAALFTGFYILSNARYGESIVATAIA